MDPPRNEKPNARSAYRARGDNQTGIAQQQGHRTTPRIVSLLDYVLDQAAWWAISHKLADGADLERAVMEVRRDLFERLATSIEVAERQHRESEVA
jgi:hypothetical protein